MNKTAINQLHYSLFHLNQFHNLSNTSTGEYNNRMNDEKIKHREFCQLLVGDGRQNRCK